MSADLRLNTRAKVLIAAGLASIVLLLTGHFAATATSDSYSAASRARMDSLRGKLGLGSDGMALGWSGGRTAAQTNAQEWAALEAVRPCPDSRFESSRTDPVDSMIPMYRNSTLLLPLQSLFLGLFPSFPAFSLPHPRLSPVPASSLPPHYPPYTNLSRPTQQRPTPPSPSSPATATSGTSFRQCRVCSIAVRCASSTSGSSFRTLPSTVRRYPPFPSQSDTDPFLPPQTPSNERLLRFRSRPASTDWSRRRTGRSRAGLTRRRRRRRGRKWLRIRSFTAGPFLVSLPILSPPSLDED